MAKRKNVMRMMVCTLISALLIMMSAKICISITQSAYHYTEDIIVSEAERVKSTDVSKMTLTITQDTTIDDIAKSLYEEGCITNETYFIAEAKLNHQTSGFIPGDYSISSNMSSGKILNLITTNITDESETIKFTIPEGYTIDQIANLLDDKNIVSKDNFLNAVQNRNYESEYSFLKNVPHNDQYKYKLEGYLFPDTYIVHKDITSEEIIIMMLNRFEEILSRYTTYISSSPYSVHELLTVASIVEQEAKLDEERPMIAGVIYNRLNADMKLQMCSTVQYSLNKRKNKLALNDLSKDSPYNTYLYYGLPIGPICNPGEACLKAALMPSTHDDYYFVLEDENTGSHYFSQTLEEHNAAKNQYHQTKDINFTE